MTDRAQEKQRRLSTGILLAALALVLSSFFFKLDIDPPGSLLTRGHSSFLTDEQTWAKDALLHTRYGDWISLTEPVVLPYGPIHTTALASYFEIVGTSNILLHLYGVAWGLIGLFAFYRACRWQMSFEQALSACLLVATTFVFVGFGRTAFPDVIATSFSLLALCNWISADKSKFGKSAALIFAACAVLTKSSYLFTLAAIIAASLYDAWNCRSTNKKQSLTLLGLCFLAIAIPLSIYASLHNWVASNVLIENPPAIANRLAGLSFDVFLSNIWKLLERIFLFGGRPVLFAAAVLGIVLSMIRYKKDIFKQRDFIGFALWFLAGFGLFCFSSYQPERYLFFMVFPLAFFAVRGCSSISIGRWVVPTVILLHLGIQAPLFYQWLSRENLYTVQKMKTDVAQKISAIDSEHTILLGGNLGPTVAFDYPTVHPVDAINFSSVCVLLKHRAPAYFIGYGVEVKTDGLTVAERMKACAENPASSVNEIGRYKLMDYWRDVVLFEIQY